MTQALSGVGQLCCASVADYRTPVRSEHIMEKRVKAPHSRKPQSFAASSFGHRTCKCGIGTGNHLRHGLKESNDGSM